MADAAHQRARAGTLTLLYFAPIMTLTGASVYGRFTRRSAAE